MVSSSRTGRRLFDSGHAILFLVEPEGEGRALAFTTSACDNPDCRTVTLQGYPVVRTRAADAKRFADLADTAEEIRAEFDIDTGRLSIDTEAAASRDEGFLDSLVRRTAESAPLLRRRWRRAKGLEDRTGYREQDWSWWEPGNLVDYCQAFPDALDFAADLDGVSYWVKDFYCINPQCECRDVVLNVMDPFTEPATSAGTIQLDYEAWEIRVQPGSASAKTLREIWRELGDGGKLRDEIRSRHEELKGIGAEIAMLARVPVDTTIEEIIAQLTSSDETLPREAIEQAARRKLEITPRLIEIIEDTIARAESGEYAEGLAHIYALFLLAQFREPAAYAPMIRLASLPREALDHLLGETLPEDYGRILGSVAHGDTAPALALANNRDVYIWSRFEALRAIVVMVASETLSRTDAVAIFGDVVRRILRESGDSGGDEDREFCTGLVNLACDLYPEELLPEIDQLFALDLVEEWWVAKDDVEYSLDLGRDTCLSRLREKQAPVTDTIEELSSWPCFDQEVEAGEESWRYDSLLARSLRDGPELTIVREGPKIGRNEPCPCGSGKKYKRCCLRS